VGTGHVFATDEPITIRGTPARGDSGEGDVLLLTIPLSQHDSFHRTPGDGPIITWERRDDAEQTEYALSFLTVAGCHAVW